MAHRSGGNHRRRRDRRLRAARHAGGGAGVRRRGGTACRVAVVVGTRALPRRHVRQGHPCSRSSSSRHRRSRQRWRAWPPWPLPSRTSAVGAPTPPYSRLVSATRSSTRRSSPSSNNAWRHATRCVNRPTRAWRTSACRTARRPNPAFGSSSPIVRVPRGNRPPVHMDHIQGEHHSCRSPLRGRRARRVRPPRIPLPRPPPKPLREQRPTPPARPARRQERQHLAPAPQQLPGRRDSARATLS